MKIKNFALALGLSAIGIGLNCRSALALDWAFSFGYTDQAGKTVIDSGLVTTTDAPVSGSGGSAFYKITSIDSFQINGQTPSQAVTLIPQYSDVNNDGTPGDGTGNDNYLRSGLNVVTHVPQTQVTASGFSYTIGANEYNVYNRSGYYHYDDVTANYTPTLTFFTAAVPWDFSPIQGGVLGVPLFIGLRMLKKKKAVTIKDSVETTV